MFRIAALNESYSDDGSDDGQNVRESTKEAKEAEAYSLYTKALGLLRHGDTKQAEDVLCELIDHDFLQEAWETLEEKGSEAIHPGLQLLYSIQKNLAAMATQRKDYKAAMESYLEAVKIDNSEVSVWYKMGMTALKLEDFQLAKVVFAEGLECNPKHWPCLDNLIPILYSLDNYYECLNYISKAFEMDLHYEKGHAFRNKMYKEQPFLVSYTEEFFKECGPDIHDISIQQEDAKEYIEDALRMRRRRQELSKPPEPERLQFPTKLQAYSWRHVGEVLVDLYDRVVTSDPPISMGLRVIIPDYTDVLSVEEESANAATETTTPGPDAEALVKEPCNDPETDKVAEDDIHSDKPEEMDVDEALDNPKQETNFEEVHRDIKELAEIGKPSSPPKPDEDKTNIPFTSYAKNEPETSASKVAKEAPDCENAGDDEDGEENDSLLEAVNTAHSLIDSLSPGKATGPYSNETQRPKVPLFVLDNQIEKSSCKESEKLESDSPRPSMVKSTSYGFTVTELLSPDSGISKPPCLSGGTITTSVTNVANKPTAENNADLTKGSCDLSKSDVPEKTIKSPTSTGLVSSSEVDPRPDIILTVSKPVDIESPVTSVHSSPSTGSFLISNLLSTASSVNYPSPHISVAKSLTPVLSSPGYNAPTSNSNHVSTPALLGSTAVVSNQLTPTITPAVTSQASAVSLYDSVQGRYSDHGYAKGSKDRIQSLPVSVLAGSGDTGLVSISQGQGHMKLVSSTGAGSVPVTQSLQSSFDPMVVESGLRSALSMDMDDRSPGGRRGQKRRRISMATEEIMMYGKRRSARVRNTGRKKEEETVNFTDLLMAFLPSTLKSVQEEEVAMETDKVDSGPDTSTKNSTGSNQSLSQEPAVPPTQQLEEETGVKAFLSSCQKNAGLIFLMDAYLHEVAKLCKVKWPGGLSDTYITVFNKVRKHLYMPCVFDRSEPSENFQELAQICLVWAELVLDKWLVTRAKSAGSPVLSPKAQAITLLLDSEVPAFYDEDILFLTILCGDSDRLGPIWIDHCIRVYWMQARYLVLKGNMNEALCCFDRTKEYLEYGKAELCVEQVFMPNCKIDNVINTAIVDSQSEQLEKNQSVAETQRLYDSQEYNKVVDILLQTFSQAKSKVVRMVSDPAERQSQLMLLQDALYKTADYPKCLLWGEESFNETYQAYRGARKSDERAEWVKTMIQIFVNLQSVLEKKPDVIQTLPSAKLVRLTQNLIQVIDASMSLPESVQNMAIDTVLPWILLYLLIKHEEDKIQGMCVKDSETKCDLDDNMAASDMLLNIAHDYLGSRGWCSKSDGALLLFIMKALKQRMEVESSLTEEYQQGFEQCIYCLYGHPNKRTKAKHLQDHNITGITLEWEQAIDLFDYFKPKTVPEFDGYQSEKISAELEGLLKRIILLVPESSKHMGVAMEEIQNYIESSVTSPPSIPEGKEITLPVISEVYYLLADYYLKNKESLKAIKFYIQDLCMNPNRLDSWAGMALARMSQLESRLTSTLMRQLLQELSHLGLHYLQTELKMDTPIYKKSIAALRCFKRAVEIDDTNSKLWLEYGTLAYQLHSHASRQLRWKKWFSMSDEMVQIAVESKREMLQTALDCYRIADQCESDAPDEEWLHNYMQGKCLEKLGKPAREVIPFYFKALESVHEEHAKYPKKIVYAYVTPHLSVESLEMFFRIHAGILKALMKNGPDMEDQDYIAFIKFINEAATCPFVRRVEKGQEGKSERESASSADESSSSAFNSPACKKGQGQSSQSDHTYFRQNINSGTPSTNLSGDVSADQSMEVSGVTNIENKVAPAVVKTFELHSEDQKSQGDIKLTETECPKLSTEERSSKGGNNGVDKAKEDENLLNNKESPGKTAFSIVDILCDSPQTGKEDVLSSEENRSESTDKVVRNVLTHIGDVIEKKVIEVKDEPKDNTSTETNQSIDMKKDNSQDEVKVPMEVDEEEMLTKTTAEKIQDSSGKTVTSQKDKTSPGDENQDKTSAEENISPKTEDLVDILMKKPREELHKYLIEQCRKALEICLQRFPTHYKSHYRLAYLYLHSPYHKDLSKAHNILLGVSKWQQYPYMPCQGLFGERKPTKFFQGIWKIPIDEIDRAGSFPSHLNRCIQIILNVLKEERDSQTLHQVHLQLNRQPEPGKKYLRDAEKKYYALMSHRYTLDAVEMRTEDMKKTSDMEERLKFLLNVYRIWEHGTHKLNKHVERTNRLLAEAYRVVIRKLETLPHNMLLDQAVRFCKHQMAQKNVSKLDKTPDGKNQGSDGKGQDSRSATDSDGAGVKMPKLISLANIMKSQTSYSMVKATQSKQAQQAANEAANKTEPKDKTDLVNPGITDPKDVIVLSDSSEAASPIKAKPTEVPTGPPTANPKAPTVKIKMGLLQAVKRLKPTTGESDTAKSDADTSDAKDMPKLPEDSESEAPIPTASEIESDSEEGSSSSSSTSSSSGDSSSSGEDESDDDDEEDNDNADDEDDESESDDESEESSDDNVKTKPANVTKTLKPEAKKVPLKLKPKPVEIADDEMDDDSSDDGEGVPSSNEDMEKDDDKDEDYKASEDEDDDVVIMREEFSRKGRAIIPSPPHRKEGMDDTEVLVQTVPDFDPLISTLISSEMASRSTKNAPASGPKPSGPPKPVQRHSSNSSAIMIIDSD